MQDVIHLSKPFLIVKIMHFHLKIRQTKKLILLFFKENLSLNITAMLPSQLILYNAAIPEPRMLGAT